MDPLLNPGVSPLAAPGVLPDGTRVRPYPAMGTTKLDEPVFFTCTMPNASIHRPDGKRLAFMNGVFKTDIRQDVEYLDNEITEGHPYVKRATDVEVKTYEMKSDPRATIEKELRPKIELEIREKLEQEIRAQVMMSIELENADASKLGGVDGPSNTRAAGTDGNGTTVILTQKPKEISAAAALAVKLAQETAKQRPPITPVSTVDVAGAAAGSGGGNAI